METFFLSFRQGSRAPPSWTSRLKYFFFIYERKKITKLNIAFHGEFKCIHLPNEKYLLIFWCLIILSHLEIADAHENKCSFINCIKSLLSKHRAQVGVLCPSAHYASEWYWSPCCYSSSSQVCWARHSGSQKRAQVAQEDPSQGSQRLTCARTRRPLGKEEGVQTK